MDDLLVLVRWIDAHFDFEREDDGYRDDYTCETVGWIDRDSENWLSIAAERTPEGPRAITHIPRRSVLTVSTLTAARRTHADNW